MDIDDLEPQIPVDLPAIDAGEDPGGIVIELPDDPGTLPVDEGPQVTVHGEPWNDIAWAQAQTEDGFCVPVSVAMIASEMTGETHSEAETVQAAIELGLLTQGEDGTWSGMTAQGAEVLLEHLGVPAHVEDANGIDTIRQHLDAGNGVIAALDSDEIWFETGEGELAADHALVVTGVDDARGVVILNDPGQPEGAGFEVSIAEFEDAWADSGNQIVVTDAGMPVEPQGAEAAPPGTLPPGFDDGGTSAGAVVIEGLRWVVPIAIAGGVAAVLASRAPRPEPAAG